MNDICSLYAFWLTCWILTIVWLTAGAAGLEIQSGSMPGPTFAIMLYFVHSHELTALSVIGLISRIDLHSYESLLSQHSPLSFFLLYAISEVKIKSKLTISVILEGFRRILLKKAESPLVAEWIDLSITSEVL